MRDFCRLPGVVGDSQRRLPRSRSKPLLVGQEGGSCKGIVQPLVVGSILGVHLACQLGANEHLHVQEQISLQSIDARLAVGDALCKAVGRRHVVTGAGTRQ